MKLKDKNAVVTGGTRGIGKAIVLDFARNGANIVFTYFSSEEAAKELEKEVSALGVKVFSLKADAAKMEDAQKTIDLALEKLGSVDILVNNAGITKDNLLLRMSNEDFDSVVDANLKSVFNHTKAVLKPMMSKRSGKIINITSVVGIIGNPGQANYVASKAGIIGLTKSNAKELASRNINVNAVAPGFVETDMTNKLNDKQKEAILSQVPLKRMAQPEDIAKTVTFLSSDDANYITGQVICVDGGMVM